ncbi:hypothetical protein [Microbacterium sp. Se63.02b]|uniref:hypothetical protein n=1 Tax=Microbacterium sp. Se63.02b TaxID=2709304 RepID=UPI0016055678|nr:hypothetical protein [Microbacterium sp. Se63.02b]QNA92244.1 hypothetical protein G4G29_07275 [Microbacterium sp. Se63.02b]
MATEAPRTLSSTASLPTRMFWNVAYAMSERRSPLPSFSASSSTVTHTTVSTGMAVRTARRAVATDITTA